MLDKLKNLTIRKLPPALIIAAAVFLFVLGRVRKDIIFLSLAEIAFTVLLFFILFTVFFLVKDFKINLRKKETVSGAAEDAQPVMELSDGLMEIQKEESFEPEQEKNLFLRICEISFIIIFLVLSVWRVLKMFALFPIAGAGLNFNSSHSIVDAVLVLLFPLAMLIYLKIKKDENTLVYDKLFKDLLAVFSYTAAAYAVVITISSTLKLEIIFILKWIYYAAALFIPIWAVYNIVLYVIKKEKINISLKSLYSIKYSLRILPAVILGLGFVLFISTSIFVVEPHQQALVFRLGNLKNTAVKEEGIHFKLPFPIDKADIYNVHRVNSMQIGYQSTYSANYLWTKSHDGGENTMLLGGGNEIVAVNIKVIYKISDLYSYVRTCANPEEVLKAAAYEALMYRTVDTTLDEFLTVDRSSLSAELMQELLQFCKEKKLGLTVLQVNIESIHPPVDIADIYQRVVTAMVVKNTIITRAHAEAAKKIIDAQKENRMSIENAKASGHNRESEAQKEMAVYYAAMQAYAISPASFELVKYLDTYEKIIGKNKVYVFSPRMEGSIQRAVIGNKTGTNVIGVNNE